MNAALDAWLTGLGPDLGSALLLFAAFVVGVAIGIERGISTSAVGIRTCSLVALANAGFACMVVSRVPAAGWGNAFGAVATGVGFLGAGAIMREGLNVKGLNTAATLWCAAAVGVACGAGLFGPAAVGAAMIVGVNIVIRPIVSLIDRAPRAGAEVERAWRITATCTAEAEATIRLLLLKQIAASKARLRRLETEDIPCPDGATPRVALVARLIAPGDATETLETIVGRLSLEPAVTRVGWAEEEEG